MKKYALHNIEKGIPKQKLFESCYELLVMEELHYYKKLNGSAKIVKMKIDVENYFNSNPKLIVIIKYENGDIYAVIEYDDLEDFPGSDITLEELTFDC